MMCKLSRPHSGIYRIREYDTLSTPDAESDAYGDKQARLVEVLITS